MPKMMKCLVAMVAVCLTVWMPVKSGAQTTPSPCILGYTVGFFNGVWNTELDAMDGMNGIQGAVREVTGNSNDTYNNEDVAYVMLYNHTGSTVGAGKWQDVAETWEQRANELDATGMLAQDVLMLAWEFENGASGGTLNLMTGQSTDFSATANQFLSDFTLSTTKIFGLLTANPPTQADYAAQDNALSAVAAAGRKLLLVAHSQGNLFMNPAYDFIQPVVGSTRVKAVHIAPASPTLRGQYILSYNDLVINALRAQGGSTTVQPNNIGIPFSTSDASGHMLVATYLDPSRNGRPVTEQLLVGALAALTAPVGCAVSVTPQTDSLSPGGSVLLTANLNPAPSDAVLATEYAWSIAGNAGGTFTGGVTTLNTTSAAVTYNLPSGAAQATSDTVSVKVLVAKTVGDYIDAETLGTGTATVTATNGLAAWNGVWNCTSSSYPPGYTLSFFNANPSASAGAANITYLITFSSGNKTSKYVEAQGTTAYDPTYGSYAAAYAAGDLVFNLPVTGGLTVNYQLTQLTLNANTAQITSVTYNLVDPCHR